MGARRAATTPPRGTAEGAARGPRYDRATAEGRGHGSEVHEIIRRAQGGDGPAFAQLYVLFFHRVYRYFTVRLGDNEDAEELAQDLFERLMAILPAYDPARGEFAQWLFSVARNLATDHVRKRERARTSPLNASPGAECSARAGWDSRRFEGNAAFHSIINELPAIQRRILALRFIFDLHSDEIADVTGRSPEAVRQIQHRALKSLSHALHVS